MSRKNKVKIFKIMLLIIVIAIFIGGTVYFFPFMKNLSTFEGQVLFKDKIKNTGMLGIFILLGLQLAQIFLIIVPGEPIEILAGMCYR